jgi:hypothetical protein
MRRIAVALVVALFALTLAGCGGTADTPTQQPTTPAQPTPAAPQAEPLVDRSPVEVGAPETFPSLETTPPPAIVQQKLDAKRPMLLFFYDSAQEITAPQRAEVDAVMREYRGLIDLVTFDVTSGSAAAPGDAAQAAATFAGQLGIKSTPYIVIVNDERTITWRWLGFIDRELIGREVLSATE